MGSTKISFTYETECNFIRQLTFSGILFDKLVKENTRQ